MKLFIIYSNKLFSDGLEAIISGNNNNNFEIVNSYPFAEIFTKNNKLFEGIHILIIEVDKIQAQELNAIYSVLKDFPDLKILLLSTKPSIKYGMELLDSGISAYLLKTCTQNDLFTALKKIAENKEYFCSEITKEIIHASNSIEKEKDHILTEREIEILSRMLDCQSSNEIANSLNISENTVKTHKRNIQAKLGTRNILELFSYALKNNILDIKTTGLCPYCPHFTQT